MIAWLKWTLPRLYWLNPGIADSASARSVSISTKSTLGPAAPRPVTTARGCPRRPCRWPAITPAAAVARRAGGGLFQRGAERHLVQRVVPGLFAAVGSSMLAACQCPGGTYSRSLAGSGLGLAGADLCRPDPLSIDADAEINGQGIWLSVPFCDGMAAKWNDNRPRAGRDRR